MSETISRGVEFPGLSVRQLTPDISWRFYRHWGQGYLAGEGIEQVNGDRSGCVHYIGGFPYTDVPHVAQARVYESRRGWLSAVYSYPRGIGAEDDYFWEIYSGDILPDPERFATEAEMEERVKALLS